MNKGVKIQPVLPGMEGWARELIFLPMGGEEYLGPELPLRNLYASKNATWLRSQFPVAQRTRSGQWRRIPVTLSNALRHGSESE